MCDRSCNHLVKDVHVHFTSPEHKDQLLVQGSYTYYHYLCDGLDDRGWGCGYRTLQTLASWIHEQLPAKDSTCRDVPSIREVQLALVTMGDKEQCFVNSRDWIGSFEVCLCLDYFYNIPCKIIHVKSGADLQNHIDDLKVHFKVFGSPIMMGGDSDASSKGILGICENGKTVHVLVLDPHFVGDATDYNKLHKERWIQWRPLDSFMTDSFYNMCLPQLKSSRL